MFLIIFFVKKVVKNFFSRILCTKSIWSPDLQNMQYFTKGFDKEVSSRLLAHKMAPTTFRPSSQLSIFAQKLSKIYTGLIFLIIESCEEGRKVVGANL